MSAKVLFVFVCLFCLFVDDTVNEMHSGLKKRCYLRYDSEVSLEGLSKTRQCSVTVVDVCRHSKLAPHKFESISLMLELTWYIFKFFMVNNRISVILISWKGGVVSEPFVFSFTLSHTILIVCA